MTTIENNNGYNMPERYSKDPQQREVILHEGGRSLVLAPAGCGKTDILAERVVRAMMDGIPSEDMAILTFTNRASREMQERVADRLGAEAEGLFIGSIHRYCLQLLYSEGAVPQETVIVDPEDEKDILRQLSGRENPNYKDIHLIERILSQIRSGHNKEIVSRPKPYLWPQLSKVCETFGLQYNYLGFQELAMSISGLMDDKRLPIDCYAAADILRLAHAYSEYKQKYGLMSFDDCLIRTYDYLKRKNGLRKKKWLQVDEVQDLNPLQMGIIDLIADEDASILYLGDACQSIFSFIGAHSEMVNTLKAKCTKEFHLCTNYRATGYLTNVSNAYAYYNLHVSENELSRPVNYDGEGRGRLTIHNAAQEYPSGNGLTDQYTIAFQTAMSFPDDGGKTAILVPTNNKVDTVSDIFTKFGVPHFKVSDKDVFLSPEFRLLLAHLNALVDDNDLMSWSRVFSAMASCEPFTVRDHFDWLRGIGLLPSDILCNEGSSYVQRFLLALDNDVVVFDTEATGLDVFTDDIMQIAAFKLRGGKIIGRFNVFLEGDAGRIPAKLKDKPNPLAVKYGEMEHKPRNQALEDFLYFVGDSVLIGQNVEYDYRLLDYNLRRDCGIHNFTEMHCRYFDTLKLSRLLLPGKNSYKLENLIQSYDLKGENTHLADDDALATVSLVELLREKALIVNAVQEQFIPKLNENCPNINFKSRYLPIYSRAKAVLYVIPDNPSEPAVVTELRKAYDEFRALGLISHCEKFEYICEYLTKELFAGELNQPLKTQLDRHLRDIDMLKEIDLCNTGSIRERFVISTVHKAKGLGFDNVIVTDVTDKTYPACWKKQLTDNEREESARLLYVAITRAKKRLCLIGYNQHNGKGVKPSPFIDCIQDYFMKG